MNAQPLPVVINRDGGTAGKLGEALGGKVREAFATTGRDIDLHLVKGRDVTETVRGVAGDVVAVGGGDGTLACAAGELCQQGRSLAVLPLGTRNHFALQIGLDDGLEQAADVAANGRIGMVDVGMAGERLFLNNASLGLYTRLVRERDRLTLPKWLATIPATISALRYRRERHLRLRIDGLERQIKTPLLFVGNNRYLLDRGQVGQRESLSDGVLSLFAVAPHNGAGLLAMALRILFGRANLAGDFATIEDLRELFVEGVGSHHVACDGEVCEMAFPLTFAIRPAALSVMMPA